MNEIKIVFVGWVGFNFFFCIRGDEIKIVFGGWVVVGLG